MSFSFKTSVDEKYQERYDATAPIAEVDAVTFVASSKYLDEKPFPFQSLIIKLFYGLWKKYPLTADELDLLRVARDNWGIVINLDLRDPHQFVEVLILVCGRRATKSSLISYIQTYEAYKLICKGDPQKYYGIRKQHQINIINCAKDGDQAKSPFILVKNNIKRMNFFQPYIDYTKDNETELRLFSPADLLANKKIQQENELRPKGMIKKNFLEGSILISAITTSAASKRGKAIISLTFDEFAHFDRAKITSGTFSDADIASEMPQTDYAMFKALTPSVKDFKEDGKILVISSPKEKGGEFYKLYCDAGGREQVHPERVVPNPNYLMLQLATWEANPTKPQEQFTGNFKKDPVGAAMEYGAHFGEPSSVFMDPGKVDEMVDPEKRLTTWGLYGYGYVIAVDPASKGDTYAVAWGHSENNRGNIIYHIDGVHGFRPTYKIVDGKSTKVNIDPEMVLDVIIGIADSFTRSGGRVLEICYDQWSSVSSIFTLQKLGYAAFETTFTNKYKAEMYGDFLEKLNLGQVCCFAKPPEDPPTSYRIDYNSGWLEQTKLEIKYLEKITSGNTVYYGAPSSGPITTDDCADVCFPAGTGIFTSRGIIDIEEVKEGDLVFTHRGQFKPVIKTFARPYIGDILHIETRGHRTVSLTPNHPVFSIPRNRCKYKMCSRGICKPACGRVSTKQCTHNYKDQFTWLDAKHLKKNDIVMLPRLQEAPTISEIILQDYVDKNNSEVINGYIYMCDDKKRNKKLLNKIPVTSQLAEIIGWYLAEGSASHNQVFFSLGPHAHANRERLHTLVHDVFNIELTHDKKSGQSWMSSYVLVQFFKQFGGYARDKSIPLWLLLCTKNIVGGLIRGLWLGDGCVSCQKNYIFGSTSKHLIYQLQLLLRKFDVRSVVSGEEYCSTKGLPGTLREIQEFPQRQLRVTVDATKLHEIVCNPNFQNLRIETHNHEFFREEGICFGIRNISKEKFNGMVHNLEVAEDNSYVTTSLTVHNCSNLVHRLVLRNSPNAQNIKKLYQQTGRPVVIRSGIRPIIGSSGFFNSTPSRNIRARVNKK